MRWAISSRQNAGCGKAAGHGHPISRDGPGVGRTVALFSTGDLRCASLVSDECAESASGRENEMRKDRHDATVRLGHGSARMCCDAEERRFAVRTALLDLLPGNRVRLSFEGRKATVTLEMSKSNC